MTKRKDELDKVYQKNYVKCLSCDKTFHRPKSLCKSNIFCSIECKSIGMTNKITKPMRKGTGLYDKETPNIRRKYYKYKRFDRDKYNTQLDYDIDFFINKIKKSSCYYCGDDSNKLGFDRKDNNKGHIIDNVLVCCEICNMTRGDRYSVEEMTLLGEVIKKIKDSRNETN
jgi:hypothetical protein